MPATAIAPDRANEAATGGPQIHVAPSNPERLTNGKQAGWNDAGQSA